MFSTKIRQTGKLFQKIQAQVRTKSEIDRFLTKFTKENPEFRDFQLTQEVWEDLDLLIKDFRYRPWLYTKHVKILLDDDNDNEEPLEDFKTKLRTRMQQDLVEIFKKHYEQPEESMIAELMKWRENN